jgi:hypothetical protein
MALIFMDGFDKYGPVNFNPSTYLSAEYTTVSGVSQILAGLSSSGSALNFTGNNATVTKSLGANYSRLIGGMRFSSSLAGANGGITFFDAATAQASISINSTSGTIKVTNGVSTGTTLGTSVASVAANSVHYLEWDISFANAGSYQVWLDGVSILSGSGDTTFTANNFANAFQVGVGAGGGSFTVDDLYIFDSTGTTNNAPLLTSPRIETQFPIADSAVQFGIGAATLGSGGLVSRGANPAVAAIAAALLVRPLTPSRSCTLNSISFTPLFSNPSANYRVCVYTDSAGNPGTLMASSGVLTGATSGTVVTGTLTTPQSLIAGTQYWLGFISDVAASNIASYEITAQGRYAANTFASGPPATAPAMTVATTTPLVWGGVTNTNANFYEVGLNPTSGNLSYLFDATVGHEDLYTYPSFVVPPLTIYGVAVKANVAKSDAGAKTVSVRLKSGITDSPGSVSSFAPAASYGWMTSLFPNDRFGA